MLKKFAFLSLWITKCFSLDLILDIDEDSITLDPPSYVSEATQKKPLPQTKKSTNYLNRRSYIELLPGYYYPTNQRIRKIYGNGGFNGQIDAGVFFHERLAFFLRGGAYWANGKSTVLKNKTSITLGNITFGLKYVVPLFDRFHYYIGGGGRVFFLRINNSVDFVQRNVSSNKLGGTVITGFWLYLSKTYPVFFDIFLDYSFYKFNFKSSIASKRNSLTVNGPTVGVGLGYQF